MTIFCVWEISFSSKFLSWSGNLPELLPFLSCGALHSSRHTLFLDSLWFSKSSQNKGKENAQDGLYPFLYPLQNIGDVWRFSCPLSSQQSHIGLKCLGLLTFAQTFCGFEMKKKKKGGVLKSYSWFLFIIILTFTKKNHKMSLLPVQNLTE